jgi:hypothetical protein
MSDVVKCKKCEVDASGPGAKEAMARHVKAKHHVLGKAKAKAKRAK